MSTAGARRHSVAAYGRPVSPSYVLHNIVAGAFRLVGDLGGLIWLIGLKVTRLRSRPTESHD